MDRISTQNSMRAVILPLANVNNARHAAEPGSGLLTYAQLRDAVEEWQALPDPQASSRYGHGQAVLNGTAFVFGGGTGYFRLEFRAPRRTKRNRGRVLVWTNDPSSPLHTFRVQAKSKQKRRRVPSFFGL